MVRVWPEVDDISTGGSKYLPLDDGSLIEQGYAQQSVRVKLMAVRTDGKPITALGLELFNDPEFAAGGPGRSIWGTGAAAELELRTTQPRTQRRKFAK